MIVANKFQTGFDQPKLCAMYVDKQLAGVAAVQTLSRLNRFVPGKTTMVLDFVNDAEEILAAFKPYFEEASLVATTDPNLIHDIGTKLDTSGIYTFDDVDAVATALVRKKGNNALNGAMQPVKQRYIAAYNAAKAAGDQQRVDELDIVPQGRRHLRASVRLPQPDRRLRRHRRGEARDLLPSSRPGDQGRWSVVRGGSLRRASGAHQAEAHRRPGPDPVGR